MWNSILEILEDKAKQGVDVRVMYDDLGCLPTLKKSYPTELEKKGINISDRRFRLHSIQA